MANVVGELTALRSRHERHFLLDDGSFQASLGRNQCYPDGQGGWGLVDAGWHDQGAYFQSNANEYVVTVDKALSAGAVRFALGPLFVDQTPVDVGYLNASTKATRRLAVAANVAPTLVDPQTLRFDGIFPRTQLDLVDTGTGFKENWRFTQLPNLPDPTSFGWQPADTWVVFRMAVTPSAGLIAYLKGQALADGAEEQDSEIRWGDAANPAFLFTPAFALDAANRRRRVRRRFIRSAGQWYVLFGMSYRGVVNAQYPVVLDPTTTINDDATDGDILFDRIANTKGAGTTAPWMYTGLEWDDGSGKGSPGPKDWVHRTFFKFALSDWASRTVSAATLGLYYQPAYGDTGTLVLDQIADFGTLDATDWDAAVLSNLTNTFPHTSPAGFKTADAKAAMVSRKNDSWLAFRLRRSSEVALNSLATWATSEHSTSTYHPKLDLTYYESLSAPTASAEADGGFALSWTNSGGLVSGDGVEVWYYKNATEPTWNQADPAGAGWTKFRSTLAYNATGVTLTGLDAGSKYYVRVREIQTISGTGYPGAVHAAVSDTTSGSGGGSSYDNTMSLGIGTAAAPAGQLDAAGGISLGTGLTAADGTALSGAGGLTLALAQALAAGSGLDAQNALSLAAGVSAAPASLLDALNLLALAQGVDLGANGGIDHTADLALSGGLGFASGAQLDAFGSRALAVALALAHASQLDLAVTVTLASGLELALAGSLAAHEYDEALGLSAAFAADSGSTLSALNLATLSADMSLSPAAALQAFNSLLLQSGLAAVPDGYLTTLGALPLDWSLAATLDGQRLIEGHASLAWLLGQTQGSELIGLNSVELAAKLALTFSTQLAGAAGLDLAAALALLNAAGLGVEGSLLLIWQHGLAARSAVYLVSTVTPEGRRLTIQLEARSLRVGGETRVLNVPREDRTLHA